jgi:hypothetical protein
VWKLDGVTQFPKPGAGRGKSARVLRERRHQGGVALSNWIPPFKWDNANSRFVTTDSFVASYFESLGNGPRKAAAFVPM